MNIIASALMGPGTFEAKFLPLSKVECIENIFVLRKSIGPAIEKVKYLLLPGICRYPFFNIVVAPLLLIYYTRRKNADIILSYHIIPHAVFAFIASLLTNRPFIACQTGLYIQRYATNRFMGFIVVYILKRAFMLNVPGEKSRAFWIKMGIPSERTNVLHSTINTNIFTPGNIEKKYDFIVLGRLASVKGIDVILKSFSGFLEHYSESTMVVVGDGPEKSKLENLAAHLKISDNVFFAGFQVNTHSWLKKSKIFIMASYSEGLPVSLMEAMASELSVIVPDVGNISDLVNNDYLIKQLNSERLLDVMLRAYENYSADRGIREGYRLKIVNGYSHDNAVKKWYELLSLRNNKLNPSTE